MRRAARDAQLLAASALRPQLGFPWSASHALLNQQDEDRKGSRLGVIDTGPKVIWQHTFRSLSTTLTQAQASQPFLKNLSPSGGFPLTVNDPASSQAVQDAFVVLEEATLAQAAQDSILLGSTFVQVLTEIHDFGLPWVAAICVCNVFCRLAVLPLAIYSQRCSTKASMINVELATAKKLQRQAAQASTPFESRHLSAAAAEEIARVRALHSSSSPAGLMAMSASTVIVSAFIFISIFSAVFCMSFATVPSMKLEGAFWFPDLTAPDPYGLPAICALLTNLNANNLAASSKLTTPSSQIHVMDTVVGLMRVASLSFFIYGAYMPSAVALLWVTNSALAVLQARMLMHPSVRSALKLPQLSEVRALAERSGAAQQQAMEEMMAENAAAQERAQQQKAAAAGGGGSGRVVPTMPAAMQAIQDAADLVRQMEAIEKSGSSSSSSGISASSSSSSTFGDSSSGSNSDSGSSSSSGVFSESRDSSSDSGSSSDSSVSSDSSRVQWGEVPPPGQAGHAVEFPEVSSAAASEELVDPWAAKVDKASEELVDPWATKWEEAEVKTEEFVGPDLESPGFETPAENSDRSSQASDARDTSDPPK